MGVGDSTFCVFSFFSFFLLLLKGRGRGMEIFFFWLWMGYIDEMYDTYAFGGLGRMSKREMVKVSVLRSEQ